jgi:hypothetical protein
LINVKHKDLFSAVLCSETQTFSKGPINQGNKEASICSQVTTLDCVINNQVHLFLNHRVVTILGAHQNHSSRRSMITLSEMLIWWEVNRARQVQPWLGTSNRYTRR